jgi:hypothetical protein
MRRWTFLLMLASAGMLLAGCGDLGPASTAPGPSSPDDRAKFVKAPPPSPPPPPPPGGSPSPGVEGSGTRIPAGSAAAGGRLDAAFEELIAVLEQIPGALSGVKDRPSAEAAAPKYLKLSQRRTDLQREIARLRLELGDEDGQRTQKYGGRVKAAKEGAAAAQARLIRNPQMLAMWGKALKAAQGASQPAPSPPPSTAQGGSDSASEQFRALQAEMVTAIRQIADLLSTVNDEASARSAAPKLRQYTSNLERSGKRLKLLMISLPPQDKKRLLMAQLDVEEDNAGLGDRMDDEIVRVAAGPAAAALGAEINGLINALDGLNRGYRRDLEKRIQRAHGGR